MRDACPDSVRSFSTLPTAPSNPSTFRLTCRSPNGAHEEPEVWGQAKDAGLSGLVIKKAGDASLVEAVCVVAQGGSWFGSPSLAWHLLSPAEAAVLAALEARGTAKEAAASMQPPLSTRTVESHLQNIYRKLGIRNAKELVRRYRIEKKP